MSTILLENIDTLASLRGSERLLMDMVLRPEWVENKVAEINHAFFEVYQRIYDLISDDDGGACWGAFTLWAPGKLAKVQCDACAMFSPAMFARFVAPAMTAQCEWLDYSIYHLDGSQCIVHLDQLLAIEALDAIEWTPEPGVPHGGDPHWYPMYRRILDAGKSLQIVDIRQGDVIPMLEMLGSKGIYFGVNDFENEEQVVALTEAVRRYR